MKRPVPIAGAVALLSVIALSQDQSVREITRQELRDKIEGGWAGQMIGVSYGAPTEFRFRQAMVPEDRLPEMEAGDGFQCARPGRSVRGHDSGEGPRR